jgi:SNF2 family DNA or RNA helicase
LKTRRVAAILDEAHKIKNPDADLTQAMHRLAPGFVRRVIMTGTPVANRPYDLWAQIYFLDQGASLGSDFKSFKERLDLKNDLWENHRRRERFEEELGTIFQSISSFAVRKTKSTAGIELPEKRIENVGVELGPRQRELYDQLRQELSLAVVVDEQLIVDDAEEVLKRLLRLVQLASNPHLIDEAYTETPAKLVKTRDLVSAAIASGSKVIVWTNFIANTEWLGEQLSEFGAVAVHGGMTIESRNAAIKAFKGDAGIRVLVATPGAAKEGLTLTIANHAIFYDRSFSLDDYLQAQDRIHRISQSQTCFVWNLLGKDTIDEWVDLLLTAKRLSAQLAQADITADEYKRLANYDFGRVVQEILGARK